MGNDYVSFISFHDYTTQKSHIPLTDYRNSILATWNTTDLQITQTAEYDPNGITTLYGPTGNLLCDNGLCPNVSNLPFGFTSALRSEVTGLIHMRARWYSLQLGQFILPDPLGYIDSYNLYSYALFDPINNWDPYGLSSGGYADNGKLKSGMTPGPATWIRDFGKWFERGFHHGAQFLDTTVIDAQEYYNEHYQYSDSEFIRYVAAAGLVFSDVGGMLLPRDGHEAMLDVAMLGLGPALKGGKAVGNAASRARKTADIPVVSAVSRQCSFTEDTPVLMCDGSLKPIQLVRAGEFVWSRSEETGEFGCREVVEPYANSDKAIIRVELLAPDGGVEVIEATANHPFYVEGRGWTRVDELDVGDFVSGSIGELLRIVALESTERVETVFNFGVEEFHSYFVGELGAWVHNCSFPQVWNEMSRSQQGVLQHFISRHGKELGLPTWQGKNAENIRRQANSVIDYITTNAQSSVVEQWPYGVRGSGQAGQLVDATVHIWSNPQNGVNYYVAKTSAGQFISAGVRH